LKGWVLRLPFRLPKVSHWAFFHSRQPLAVRPSRAEAALLGLLMGDQPGTSVRAHRSGRWRQRRSAL